MQWTKLVLRIREIPNDKCRVESIGVGGCQLKFGTKPHELTVPWLPSLDENKD